MVADWTVVTVLPVKDGLLYVVLRRLGTVFTVAGVPVRVWPAELVTVMIPAPLVAEDWAEVFVGVGWELLAETELRLLEDAEPEALDVEVDAGVEYWRD